MSSTQIADQIKIYVLTIYNEDHPRIVSAKRQLEQLGLPYIIVKAIEPTEAVFKQHYSKMANFFLMKRSLSIGEVGCYIGHAMMWKQFIKSSDTHAVFLEDDFNIVDYTHLKSALKDCLSCEKNWDLIKLFDFRPKKIISSHLIGTTTLVAYKYPASGNVGYFMNRHCAEALLKRKKVFRPVDEDMAHMWEFGIRIWSVIPNPLTEQSHLLGGSTIDLNRKIQSRERRPLRSLWGNVLQSYKLVRSILYRRKMRFKIY